MTLRKIAGDDDAWIRSDRRRARRRASDGCVGHAHAAEASGALPASSTDRTLIDALLERVLDALAKKDAKALNDLRVTEREYCDFVLPGAVAKGEQPKALTEEASEFAWDMLNTKSLYAADAVISSLRRQALHHQGRSVRQRPASVRVVRQSYNTTVLTLEDDAGGIHELTLGSIAQIDGQFKFVGLLGNR